jgi:predicted RNA binding protein YcfA (HicA-like mRNA interferase family)
LPSCTAHDVDRVLTREGFIVTHQPGSHRYYKSRVTGKILTSVPTHPGDLNRNLLKKILQQVGWSEEQFKKLLYAIRRREQCFPQKPNDLLGGKRHDSGALSAMLL